MLDIGLCITVKDEAHNIEACLGDIHDLLAEIVVIDTGSADGTPELLRDRLGIEPLHIPLDATRCCALSKPRNLGFERLRTPWLMTLDADERIEREDLETLIALDDADLPAGLLFGWDTHVSSTACVEDYKLALFRRHHRHLGLVHDTAQPSLRRSGEVATWYPDLRLKHFPNLTRQREKDAWYAWRLECARRQEPDWLRYRWFSGYMAFRKGAQNEAITDLEAIHRHRPALFPVESLNASMILASMLAASGDGPRTEAVLDDALHAHRDLREDWEVRVNFRMQPWLESAAEHAAKGNLDAIVSYPFAY